MLTPGPTVSYHTIMYISGIPISVDLPEHAIERAAERLGLPEREVVEFWQRVVANRKDDLAEVEVGHGGHIIDGRARWVVKRYSDFGIRVMTVVIREKRRR